MRPDLILAMALLALPATANSTGKPADYESRTCSDKWLCVYAVETDAGGVEFRGRNLSAFPVTLALRVTPRNLKREGGDKATMTLPAGADLTLLAYTRRRPDRGTDYRYRFDWEIGEHRVRHDDEYRYRLPYARGKRHRVLQGFGSRFSHTGLERYAVDFDMDIGTPVYAARDGVVARVVEKHGEGCWERRCAGKANFIVVLHEDGSTGEYYHLVRNGAYVEQGQRVERGQKIGASGNSGHSTMPHLHFAVYEVDDDGRTRSLPITFDSADGPVSRPRRGPGYIAR